MTKKNTSNLSENLKKLNQIVTWFDNQDNLDIEKAIELVKDGTEIIKLSRERLSKIENEFKELKKDIQKNKN